MRRNNIMPKFGINIKEFLKKTVIVEAENIEKAVQKVNDAYEQEKIILDAGDYDEAEIEPSPYFGNGSGEVADGEDVSFYCHLLEDKD